MSKPRPRSILNMTLLATLVIFVLAGMAALGFLAGLSKENRALIVIASSVGVIACFVGLIYAGSFRKWLRRKTWEKAIPAWLESSRSACTPQFENAGRLSGIELKHLAIQVYSRMGYRVINAGKEDESIKLINPDGKFELVACKQQPDPIATHQVHSLQLELKLTKAVRGFFWAPAGFTREAMQWASHKPIVLADGHEIGRLVDCAHAKGSWLLEY